MTNTGADTSKSQTKLVCFYLHGQEYAAVINDWTDGVFQPLPVTPTPGGSVPSVRR